MGLKAIIHDGNEEGLMMMGRRLSRVLLELDAAGVVLSFETLVAIEALDWAHMAQGLRYPSALSNGDLPEPPAALAALTEVLALAAERA